MKNDLSKYEFGLDLETNNSRKLVNDCVTYNSTVLEFGPAGGELTKFLSIVKHCQIDIVEIDANTGQEAAQFARNALLGDEEGNIEKYYWEDRFSNNTYDHIIFSDVLEHLYNPWEVLKRCIKLLKLDGSIIISIPNIANNNVILNLIRDRFDYTPWGLLDNTHIRFFTIYSLEEMIESAGLVPVKRFATYAPLGTSEINVNYNMFSYIDTDIIKTHLLGNIYQFIYEVKVNKEDIVIQKNLKNFCNENEIYESNIYIDCGSGFSEDKKVRSDLHLEDDGHFVVVFNLENFHNIQRLRFDPLEGMKIILLLNSILIDGIESEVGLTNCIYVVDKHYVYSNEDPVVEINSTKNEISSVTVSGYIYMGKAYYDKLFKLRSVREKVVENLNMELHEEKKVVENLNMELQSLKNSWSFKLGRGITYIPRKIKNFLLE